MSHGDNYDVDGLDEPGVAKTEGESFEAAAERLRQRRQTTTDAKAEPIVWPHEALVLWGTGCVCGLVFGFALAVMMI